MKVHINRGDLFCLLYNPVPLLIALLELYVGNITGKVGLNPMTTLNMSWVEVYRLKLNLERSCSLVNLNDFININYVFIVSISLYFSVNWTYLVA